MYNYLCYVTTVLDMYVPLGSSTFWFLWNVFVNAIFNRTIFATIKLSLQSSGFVSAIFNRTIFATIKLCLQSSGFVNAIFNRTIFATIKDAENERLNLNMTIKDMLGSQNYHKLLYSKDSLSIRPVHCLDLLFSVLDMHFQYKEWLY